MLATFIAVLDGAKEIDLSPLSARAVLGYPIKTFRYKNNAKITALNLRIIFNLYSFIQSLLVV